MKHTIEFNLPEEESEMRKAINGARVMMVIFDWANDIRSLDKYESKTELSPELVKALEDPAQDKIDVVLETRNMLLSRLVDIGVNIYED